MNSDLTANAFIKELEKFKTGKESNNVSKSFKGNDGITKAFGVKFGDVFKLAKEFTFMEILEINKLLDSNYYEIRIAAVSIMGFQARNKKVPEQRKKELFELYLSRHDRLNNWDFVDRAAPDVIGGYLLDKPRDILYKLAKSKNVWERRTAIVSTYAFIKKNDIADTFHIAEILINDEEEFVNKAVGGWIREAGKRDLPKLKKFLDKYAKSMPRVTLRYAIEKLDRNLRDYYMNLKKENK